MVVIYEKNVETLDNETIEGKDNIYSTVPVSIEDDIEERQRKLANYLQENAGKFYKSKELAEMAGYKTSGTRVELRKAITELIEEKGCPIVANDKGFCWARHPNMIKHYIESLRHRQQGLERRISALQEILNTEAEL